MSNEIARFKERRAEEIKRARYLANEMIAGRLENPGRPTWPGQAASHPIPPQVRPLVYEMAELLLKLLAGKE